MDCFRVFTDADGETHFEDIELTLQQIDELGKSVVFPRSQPSAATSIFFVHRPESAGPTPWHNVKQRQYVLRLAGEMEIEVSDGAVRRTGPGSVMLAEDTTGKGHRASQVWGDGMVAIVRLADDATE
jgi:hypothetical protein